jgi:hypothetical protein
MKPCVQQRFPQHNLAYRANYVACRMEKHKFLELYLFHKDKFPTRSRTAVP